MPAHKRITRDAIIKAALKILRKDGYAAVNARSVAKMLKCSTQPIYAEFKNMQELKEELHRNAAAIHTQKVMEVMQKGIVGHECERYRAYGMGFIHFARDEKELFRYLYLQERQHIDDVHLPEIINIIQEEYGYTQEVAAAFHQDMIYYSYGIAVLINTGYCSLTDEEIAERFHVHFMALTGIYGVPPKYAK